MSLDSVQDLVQRYVRGELSSEQAEKFEEQYFQDEELAKLVEAEQFLVRGEGLGDLESVEELPTTGAAIPTWRRALRIYSYAAGVLLVPLALLVMQQFDRSNMRSGYAVTPPPVGVAARVQQPLARITTGQIRLSSTRSAATDRPSFRFSLPERSDEQIELILPLRREWNQVSTLVLYRHGETDEPVFELPISELSNESELRVTLPGGSISAGRYRLVQQSSDGTITAMYQFEVLDRR